MLSHNSLILLIQVNNLKHLFSIFLCSLSQYRQWSAGAVTCQSFSTQYYAWSIHYVSDLHLYGCSKEAQIKALQALYLIMIQLNVMSSFYSSYWICLYYQYKSCCMFLYSLQRIGFVCLCYCWGFLLLIRICTPCF